MSLLVDKAQLAGFLKVCVGGPLEEMQVSSDYVQDIFQNIVYEVSMSAATPDWCTVLSC